MGRKVILISDSGIDGTFAVALALSDPGLEVLALAATGGNVSHEQATTNLFTVLEQVDPPRWPRIGAALPIEYERTAEALHGTDGLGGLGLPSVQLHHPHPADRLIVEQARQHPGEVTVIVLGPLTVLARAMDRDPELAQVLERIVVVGGTCLEPGDASPVAEFHFWCDPTAAHKVIHCGAPVTLLPLDITRKLIYSPADLRLLPPEDKRAGAFLRKLLPLALAPTAGLYGIEGVYLNDAVAIAAFARPEVAVSKSVPADVETTGELTRGMLVIDTRWATQARPNLDVVTSIDIDLVRAYIHKTMGTAFE